MTMRQPDQAISAGELAKRPSSRALGCCRSRSAASGVATTCLVASKVSAGRAELLVVFGTDTKTPVLFNGSGHLRPVALLTPDALLPRGESTGIFCK